MSAPAVDPNLPLQLTATVPEGTDEVLSPEALTFVATLVRRFRGPLLQLRQARRARQAELDAGDLPDFLPETTAIRTSDWTCGPIPADLRDRRVEITGPTDRKMMINALNSGANVFMADLEDATSPTWDNVVQGQRNLLDTVRGTLTFHDPRKDKHYAVGDDPAVLMVRPRGLHLPEKHAVVDGQPVPASLWDAGLFLFHCAHGLVERGTGPYLYLPKLEHHTEAAWWNEVLSFAETELGLPVGTAKVTVLVETLPASFQLDEILWALRPHIVGLNCGRWDYIFSVIKTLRAHGDRVLPDRGAVGMTQPLMRAYTQRLIRVCHRRGVHAMGGMAAQIPIKSDPEANAAALAKVRADKEREAGDGHDGTWVAHPGLVPLAREVFDRVLGDRPNQLLVSRDDVEVGRDDLVQTPTGPRTEAGLRHSIRVGVQYLAAWLSGQGCVPIDHLMEDAATAEICRAQVWQWVHHGAALDDGRVVDAALVQQLITEEVRALPDLPTRDEAADLFSDLCTAARLADFLTLPAYARLD